MKKLKLAIVGFGDVGQRLLAQYGTQAHITALGRQAPEVLLANTRFLTVDLDAALRSPALKRLAALPARVIYLAPPPAQGHIDPRMARFIARARRVEHCVYVSTTGVYGAAGGAWVTETAPLAPTEARGLRRIAAEQALKRSTIAQVSILRAPGIYALERLPIARIQNGVPAFIPKDDVPTNHIHADDLARLCWLALFRGRNRRSYNAGDGQPMMHGDYLAQVAQTFQLDPPPRLDKASVQAALSPIAWSMLAGARRVSSERLLGEWSVRLKHPNVGAFLDAVAGVEAIEQAAF